MFYRSHPDPSTTSSDDHQDTETESSAAAEQEVVESQGYDESVQGE